MQGQVLYDSFFSGIKSLPEQRDTVTGNLYWKFLLEICWKFNKYVGSKTHARAYLPVSPNENQARALSTPRLKTLTLFLPDAAGQVPASTEVGLLRRHYLIQGDIFITGLISKMGLHAPR